MKKLFIGLLMTGLAVNSTVKPAEAQPKNLVHFKDSSNLMFKIADFSEFKDRKSLRGVSRAFEEAANWAMGFFNCRKMDKKAVEDLLSKWMGKVPRYFNFSESFLISTSSTREEFKEVLSLIEKNFPESLSRLLNNGRPFGKIFMGDVKRIQELMEEVFVSDLAEARYQHNKGRMIQLVSVLLGRYMDIAFYNGCQTSRPLTFSKNMMCEVMLYGPVMLIACCFLSRVLVRISVGSKPTKCDSIAAIEEWNADLQFVKQHGKDPSGSWLRKVLEPIPCKLFPVDLLLFFYFAVMPISWRFIQSALTPVQPTP